MGHFGTFDSRGHTAGAGSDVAQLFSKGLFGSIFNQDNSSFSTIFKKSLVQYQIKMKKFVEATLSARPPGQILFQQKKHSPAANPTCKAFRSAQQKIQTISRKSSSLETAREV
jgi:hypothetical protein